MNIDVVPLRSEHFVGLREVLDRVARERRYLAFLEAPPIEEALVFFQGILDSRCPAYVALVEGHVAGWCDILRTHGQARAHVGTLGIGLLPEFRGRGIGAGLMEAAVRRAWDTGFTRIELTVRTDNANAKAFYERMSFRVEGTHRGAFHVDGEDFDTFSMALRRSESK